MATHYPGDLKLETVKTARGIEAQVSKVDYQKVEDSVRGKGKKWGVEQLKAIPLSWRNDTISDPDGLIGDIRVNSDESISLRFRYAFRWEGKVKWHQCGTWPKVSLADIRKNRDEARAMVKEGINPSDQKKATRIENQAKVKATIAEAEIAIANARTFDDMYQDWLAYGVKRSDKNAEIIRSFKKDVLPVIGHIPVNQVSENTLHGVLKKVVDDREAPRMADCLYNDLIQLFKWAEKRQPWRRLMIEGNPADLVKMDTVLPNDYDRNNERTRILSDNDVRELRDIFSKMDHEYQQAPAGKKYETKRPIKNEIQLALWISLSTICRIGELLMAEWCEIDFQNATWRIPVEHVKGRIGKKKGHLIALSPFALKHFQALFDLTGMTKYCFPSAKGNDHVNVKSVSKLVGDCQMIFKDRPKGLQGRRNDNSLVLNNGKDGEWTPHDLRRTGATRMQELGINLNVIDRCQNHVLEGSKVRRAYLHHSYKDEMLHAWSLWGDHLECVLQPIKN